MQAIKIILMCILAVGLYGVAFSQVAVRVCEEFFTVGMRGVYDIQSPALLALAWGLHSSAYIGGFLGFWLTAAARMGAKVKLTAVSLMRTLIFLLIFAAILSTIAGAVGYATARSGNDAPPEAVAREVPQSRHAAYVAVHWAYLASYGCGVCGGLMFCMIVVRKRIEVARRMGRGTAAEQSVSGEGAPDSDIE
jgi:hypothetical protein